MIGGVSVSRRFFVIAVLVAMVISLLMPVRLENDKGGVMSIMNMSFSADGEGNARMKGIVTLDGVNKNFEMRGKLDGMLGNYSGALMGDVNGEPAAMYVFYNQSLKYASLAIGAVNENTQPTPGEGYTLGDINGDANITVADLTAVVEYVSRGTDFEKEYGEAAADVNKDGSITVTDITMLVSYITKGTFGE